MCVHAGSAAAQAMAAVRKPGKVRRKKSRPTAPLVPDELLKKKLLDYVKGLGLLRAPFNIIIYKDKELQHAPSAMGLIEQQDLLTIMLPMTDSGLMRSRAKYHMPSLQQLLSLHAHTSRARTHTHDH